MDALEVTQGAPAATLGYGLSPLRGEVYIRLAPENHFIALGQSLRPTGVQAMADGLLATRHDPGLPLFSAPPCDSRRAFGHLVRLVVEPAGVELDPPLLPHGDVAGQ